MADDETHLTGTESRAGSSEHVVRYVLGASLALVVAAMAVLLLVG